MTKGQPVQLEDLMQEQKGEKKLKKKVNNNVLSLKGTPSETNE